MNCVRCNREAGYMVVTGCLEMHIADFPMCLDCLNHITRFYETGRLYCAVCNNFTFWPRNAPFAGNREIGYISPVSEGILFCPLDQVAA